jgi:predicted metalloprotease with PDZ domain
MFSKILAAAGMLMAVLASLATAAEAATAPLDSRYHLRLMRPGTHLIEVELTVGKVTVDSLEFVLPAWAPGRYAIYDFSKNLEQFRATDGEGKALPWQQIDKESWRVDKGAESSTIRVDYQIYSDDLTGSFSQFDVTHASISGPSVFMYVEGHKQDPVTLTIEAPSGWVAYTGLTPGPNSWTFHAANYDVLVDCPIEVSAQCQTAEFTDSGIRFRVVVHRFADKDQNIASLVDPLKKIVHEELAIMPPLDIDHYTFFFHFDPTLSMGDGMEHLNSTSIIMTSLLRRGALAETLETTAHEFFHTWNVKRLRPAALGPFHYTRENYSRSLWFAEGVTQYYAYVTLLRCGIWNTNTFLQRLAEEVKSLELSPGRKFMSAEGSSFDAWYFDRAPQLQETDFNNSTISYYNKGAVLAMMLDLEIRARTHGQKSLDDLMRLLYHRFFDAPATSYYLPGKGYTEADILAAASEVAGSDMSDFFQQYVSGTAAIPYDQFLNEAGLQLQVDTLPGTSPTLGVRVEKVDQGEKVLQVWPGSAADKAGIGSGDIIQAVDEQSLEESSLADRLKEYAAGGTVILTVLRHGEQQHLQATLDPAPSLVYTIGNFPQVTPEEIQLRNAWLAPAANH